MRDLNRLSKKEDQKKPLVAVVAAKTPLFKNTKDTQTK
jgi:hypothetical protein